MQRDTPDDYHPNTTQLNVTGRTSRPRTCPVPMRSWQAAAAASRLVGLDHREAQAALAAQLAHSAAGRVVAGRPPKSLPFVATRRYSRQSSCTRAWAAQQGDGREIPFERWRDGRLGCVQESCVQRGSGKGPEGGKGAAVRACEASGCVAGAGCARGAAEGVRWPRTGSSWSLACSRCS